MNQAERLAFGLSTQGSFERVLDEAATLRATKVRQYGQDRYLDPDLEHMLTITYADIYRKFIRIKELMVGNLESEAGDSLRDTLLDLANYALMGVQQLDGSVEAPYNPKSVTEEGLCVDQVAVYSPEPKKAIAFLSALLGLEESDWTRDIAETRGALLDIPGEVDQKADLNFCYKVLSQGVEFEVLQYQEGKNWIDITHGSDKPVASHLGIHVRDEEELKTLSLKLNALGCSCVQSVKTTGHTNPHIASSRRYRYVIHTSRHLIGMDTKLILRLPLEA